MSTENLVCYVLLLGSWIVIALAAYCYGWKSGVRAEQDIQFFRANTKSRQDRTL